MTATRLRKCACALALSIVFLTAGTARADVTRSFAVGINGCDGAAITQFCTPVPTVALPTNSVLLVEFIASPTHCSSIIARLFVDGVAQPDSTALAPGES